MKLVEVVVLMGAHCISPIQHTAAATEVAKVQCAVVIEKDTTAGTLRIVPAGASRHPEVVAVLDRLDREVQVSLAEGAKIEPAFAPPETANSRAQPVKPVPKPAQAAADPPSTDAAALQPDEAGKPAEEAKAEATAEPVQKDQSSLKPASQCRGTAQPKWYTNAEGRRKYRCVQPG